MLLLVSHLTIAMGDDLLLCNIRRPERQQIVASRSLLLDLRRHQESRAKMEDRDWRRSNVGEQTNKMVVVAFY